MSARGGWVVLLFLLACDDHAECVPEAPSLAECTYDMDSRYVCDGCGETFTCSGHRSSSPEAEWLSSDVECRCIDGDGDYRTDWTNCAQDW